MAEEEVLPADVVKDIKEFLRLDDGLKDARIEMKERRAEMNEHKDGIIDYMHRRDIPKLELNNGDQCLVLSEKEHKIRPDAKLIRRTLDQMIAQGVTDSGKIVEAINSCGGVNKVWTLARRSKVVRKAKD